MRIRPNPGGGVSSLIWPLSRPVSAPTALNLVAAANFGSNTVSVIDGTSWTVTHTPAAGTGPFSVDVSPDLSYLAVADAGAGPANTVTIISTSTWTPTRTITLVSAVGLQTAAISPNGSWIAVTNTNGTVNIIDTTSWTVTHGRQRASRGGLLA